MRCAPVDTSQTVATSWQTDNRESHYRLSCESRAELAERNQLSKANQVYIDMFAHGP